MCAAFAFTFDGDVVKDARIAFGGMAATPKRAAAAEAVLRGQPWSEEALQRRHGCDGAGLHAAVGHARLEQYRMKAAQNLLRRFWLETRADAPLANAAVNAFAVRA